MKQSKRKNRRDLIKALKERKQARNKQTDPADYGIRGSTGVKLTGNAETSLYTKK